MFKTALFALVFLVPVISLSQDSTTPGSDMATTQTEDLSPPAPPKYCNPCVFYSGDFNPNANPNGLLNGMFAGNVDGEVWVPFSVSTKIVVTGLFVNELFSVPPPAKASATWGIRNGVSSGDGGQVQCQGTGTAHSAPTGRKFTFKGTTYIEYTLLVKLAQSKYCQLTNPTPDPLQRNLPPPTKGQCPPDCSMSVVVDVAPTDNPGGFVSDVPTKNPEHHFGNRNINNDSFFTSTSYGFNFVPATQACAEGSPIAITKVGCHMFSAGLLGTGR